MLFFVASRSYIFLFSHYYLLDAFGIIYGVAVKNHDDDGEREEEGEVRRLKLSSLRGCCETLCSTQRQRIDMSASKYEQPFNFRNKFF